MIKKIFYNWSNIFLSILSVFLLYPYLTKVLGDEQYGVWLLISSITGYFSLLQMGVPLANVKFVSKYHATGEQDKIDQVLSSNLLFFAVLSVAVLAASLMLSYFLDVFFKIPAPYLTITRIAVILATLEVCIRFIFEIFEGVAHALQQFGYLNAVKNFVVLLRLLLMYSVVTSNNGIYIICGIVILTTLVQGCLFLYLSKRILPNSRISFRLYDRAIFVEVTGYSIYVLLLQFATRISFQTDSLVIGSFLSVSSIIYFSIASNLVSYFMQLIVGISQAIMPRMSAMDALADHAGLGESYCRYSRLTFIFVLPVCGAIYFFGSDFIKLWMGQKYASPASEVLNILTLSYLFFLVQRAIAFPILMGISKMRFLSMLMVLTALLNLVLSIVWGRNYGLAGVAWGTTIHNLLNVAGIVFYISKVLKINPFKYLLSTYLTPSYLAFAYLAPVLILREMFTTDNYVTLIFINAAGFLLYFIAFKASGAIKLVAQGA